jgi:Fatty acid hydroxylase superfamily
MATTAAVDGKGRVRAVHGGEVKTLADARREFAHKHSPWMILGATLALVAVRIAIGHIGWGDAVAVAAMLVVYPFGEWAIHAYLLHMKPVYIRGRKFVAPAARDHRAHHRAPNDLTMLLLSPKELAQLLFLAVPFTIGVFALACWLVAGSVPIGPLVSAAIAGYGAIFVYEWTHFLIHTAHRPKSRFYKAVWRNHRLHHFKNEHFWHGITNNFSDRVLGTNPDHSDVPRSETARTLDTEKAGAGVRS